MKQHDPVAVTHAERETWNRCAPSYLDSAAKLTCHAVDFLMAWAGLTHEYRALEVGCGPGHIARMMADTGARVTGVDLAADMVGIARELYPDIEFREANAEHLPFNGDTFDVVLANFVLHHFARPAAACAEIRRVLRTGGRFVFAGPVEPVSFVTCMEALSAHHTLNDLAHGPLYLGATRDDYEKLVTNAGFRDHDVGIRTVVLHLGNLDPLFETIWTMCDLSRLPRQTQDRIRDTTLEKAAPYKTDQGYAFPDRVVVGVAT